MPLHPHRVSPVPVGPGGAGPGASPLGPEHPLTIADRRLRESTRQLVWTALFVLAWALLGRGHQATGIVIAGVLVVVILCERALVRTDARRQRALDLIIAGDEAIPVPVVARLRRHLLRDDRPRVAALMAQAVDDVDDFVEASGEPHPELALTELRGEVEEVIELLSSDRVDSAQGVALAAALVQTGPAALACREDTEQLRLELGRIRFLLSFRHN
jgi:hypothetical protein